MVLRTGVCPAHLRGKLAAAIGAAEKARQHMATGPLVVTSKGVVLLTCYTGHSSLGQWPQCQSGSTSSNRISQYRCPVIRASDKGSLVVV